MRTYRIHLVQHFVHRPVEGVCVGRVVHAIKDCRGQGRISDHDSLHAQQDKG